MDCISFVFIDSQYFVKYAEKFPNRCHPDADHNTGRTKTSGNGDLNSRKYQAGRQSVLSIDQKEKLLRLSKRKQVQAFKLYHLKLT